ncbi:Gem-associated protein 8 [Myotis davidii]|uniref:Gem-associated protein 8 n=1 Tax=Myotis davidii TaxID=225400 RepID=L5M543_MYODS|nr:Gem-associated protein 8 [Myotis davidii]
MESYFCSPWYFTPGGHPQSFYAKKGRSHPFYDHHLSSKASHCDYSHSPRSGKHPPDTTSEDQSWTTEEEAETDSDDEVVCDLSNMEITEELRQYFAETERHREERRRQQQLDAQRLEDYTSRSMEPPSESPSERRQAEMKRLYGDSAAKIQAMEAAVQLSFNKHFDRKRPKYWPVIPLKF